MRRLGNIRLKVPDKSQIGHKCYLALLACIWCYPPLEGIIAKIFGVLPLVGQFSDAFFPAAMVALTVLSAGHLLKHIRSADVIFGAAAMLTVFLTAVFMPANAEYIEDQLVQILLISLPVYYVGLTLDYEESRKLLYWASLINVIVSLAYRLSLLSQGRVLLANSMSASYKVLPSVLYLLLWSIRNGGLFNWIASVLGCILILLCGTRGPAVVIATFSIVELIIKIAQMEKGWKKILYILLCVTVFFVLIIDEMWIGVVEFIAEVFEKLGFSTRIFNYLLEGEFAVSNTRENLAEMVKDAMEVKPFLGYGLMGDRVVTKGHYVHNILLEFVCHYGLIIGSLLLMAVYMIVIVALYRSRNTKHFHFLMMLACMVFIKLMLSGSYLQETYFFLLLGISVHDIRAAKLKRQRSTTEA